MTVATQVAAKQSSSVPSPGASMVVAAKAWSKKPAAAPRLAWAVLKAAWRDTAPRARWDRVVLHSPQGLGVMALQAVVRFRRQEGDP